MHPSKAVSPSLTSTTSSTSTSSSALTSPFGWLAGSTMITSFSSRRTPALQPSTRYIKRRFIFSTINVHHPINRKPSPPSNHLAHSSNLSLDHNPLVHLLVGEPQLPRQRFILPRWRSPPYCSHSLGLTGQELPIPSRPPPPSSGSQIEPLPPLLPSTIPTLSAWRWL